MSQFGAVIAVSRAGSKRQADLVRAANLTGLEITVPSQPIWTNLDEANFRAQPPHSTEIDHGSILGWFGHLNALRWLLSTNLETALIIEDDSDFDISLRRIQAPLASQAIHKIFNTTIDPRGHHYWSDLPRWELLYLGHCGDWFDAWSLKESLHTIYPDPSLPAPDKVYPTTANEMNDLGVPTKHRLLHRSRSPLCSFAYAMHRTSAARLLETSSTEGKGCKAFDVRLLELCRDWGFGCYTVNPELFHHEVANSEIAALNTMGQHEDIAKGEEKKAHGELSPTVNIRCGARMPQLAKMMQEQDRQGKELNLDEVLRQDGGCPWDPVEEGLIEEPESDTSK
jgi:hypothetical protein